MQTFIVKFQLLLMIQTLGIKCFNTSKENTSLFVDNGDTFVLNCTCFSESESSWKGPDGNDSVLTAYSDGLKISPYFNVTNIVIYGNYTIGKCHLKIENYSTDNDGIYECSYFRSGNLHIQRYNVFSRRTPTNLKIVNISENNIIYGQEGVLLNLKCTVKNGIPAATLIWSKEGLTFSNGSSDTLTYQLTPTIFDHMQNITCYINSDLLKSPLSQTIFLDILYRPQLKIIRSKNKPIIEGESVKLCCFSTSNPPVNYMSWYQNHFEVHSWNHNPSSKLKGLNTEICLVINPAYRNSTGNYACFAKNTIAKSNSVTVINVLYPPDVKVTDTISEQSIILHCIPNGNPENYIFYDWQHKSEFNEHIRYINGTPEGQLIIKTHQSRKTNEVDGIYVCIVSNGVPNLEGKINQEGQTCMKSQAPPVFVADNTPVKVGQFGKIIQLTIKIYDKLYNTNVLIKKNGTTVRVIPTIENITTYSTSYGVQIRVPGIQYTFPLHLTSAHDFTTYIVEACNKIGCTYFDVQVQSASSPEPPSNVSVTTTGQVAIVSWIPGFSGGFVQEFVLELETHFNLNFTVRVPAKDTEEKSMDYSFNNLIPNTAYLIHIYSRNEMGDSNKSNLVTFVTSPISQEESTLHTKLITLPVFTTIGLCLTIGIGIYLYMKLKAKRSFGTNNSGPEDEYAMDNQGSSVENRLYQSAEFLNPEMSEEELEYSIASSSHDNQLYQMQMQAYNENGERSLQCALPPRIGEQVVEPKAKITEDDLNYADIFFEDRQLPSSVLIHGIDNKTIYSDIIIGARPLNLLSTNDSSSESEDDFIYVDGIENYTERRKINSSQQ